MGSNKAFTFHEAYRVAIAELDDATRLAVYDAIMDYALFEIVPDFKENAVAKAVFTAMLPSLTTDQKKRADGKKGGRPASSKKENHGFEKEKRVVLKNENHSFENEETTVSQENEEDRKEKRSKREKTEEDKELYTPPLPPQGGREPSGAKTENSSQMLERLLPFYGIPQTMKDRVREWVWYKSERKQPYKEQGMKCLLRQIETNVAKYGEQAMSEVIEQSIAAQYQGIVFDRLKEPKYSPAKKAGTYDPSVYENAPQFGWGDEDY